MEEFEKSELHIVEISTKTFLTVLLQIILMIHPVKKNYILTKINGKKDEITESNDNFDCYIIIDASVLQSLLENFAVWKY